MLFENITLDTCKKNNGRAGRIILVPNYHAIIGLIVKYNHLDYLGIKTVWDSVNFLITHDSNLQSAINIAKGYALIYSIDHAMTMHKKLKEKRIYSRYNLQEITKTDPQVFPVPEEEGIRLYVLYIIDPSQTLESRSKVSAAITKEILNAPDISFANTQQTQSKYSFVYF